MNFTGENKLYSNLNMMCKDSQSSVLDRQQSGYKRKPFPSILRCTRSRTYRIGSSAQGRVYSSCATDACHPIRSVQWKQMPNRQHSNPVQLLFVFDIMIMFKRTSGFFDENKIRIKLNKKKKTYLVFNSGGIYSSPINQGGIRLGWG